MTTTIYDVAREAGVSPKTVSRVLNRDAPVGRKTRAAVEAVIASLGYVPSSAARAMRLNRSGLVALITGAISLVPERTDSAGLPDLLIVQGIQSALEATDLTLLIADTGGRRERVPELMRTFAQHRVEGLVHVADHYREVALPPTPGIGNIVLANGYDRAGTPAVVPDDARGQRELTEALIAHGHERIAYLTLSEGTDATRLRTGGYRAALEAAGIGFDPDLVVDADAHPEGPDAETRRLRDAIGRVLDLPRPPSVVCLGNDRMAARAYGLLRARGLRVPEDVSVAGYDDHRAVAENLYPALTTMELPYRAIGQAAARTLAATIRGEGAPRGAQRVAGALRWRGSVAPGPRSKTKTNQRVSQRGRIRS